MAKTRTKTKNELYENGSRDIAFRLRAIRDHEGFSVVDWAEKLGVSGATVTAYESGKEIPHLLYCYGCCETVGMSIDDLILPMQNEFIKKLFFG